MEVLFTNHAKERLQNRKFVKQEIIDAIKNPDRTLKKYGKYYYQKRLEGGIIEIVCERTENVIKVITLYWL